MTVRKNEVTVIVTSCGRKDLLEKTLSSFFHYNTFPVSKFVVIEDGKIEHQLDNHFSDKGIEWLSTNERVGQIRAIDKAYKTVNTEYIFHCEDDWEFFGPGFIEKSLAIMKTPNILQVWIRSLSDTNRHPVMPEVFTAEGIPYQLIEPEYDSGEWGTWHGFSFNPGLRRHDDYKRLGSFGRFDPLGQKKSFEVEREISEFYWKEGLLAAIIADNNGEGYCKHIGWGRRVE